MPTLYSNFANGTTTDAPLLIGATTVNSAAFANLPTVASPDAMWIVLDPAGASGPPEIVQVTAHTAAATSCTIVRAQQSTVAREHPSGTAWRVALTKTDADEWATTAYADALGTEAATASTIMRRDAAGRSKVAAPSAATDIANRAYVDGTTQSSANTRYQRHGAMVSVWTVGGGSTPVTLAAGYRPSAAVTTVGFAAGTAFEVTIATTGAVTYSGGAPAAAYSVTFAAA